MWFLKQQQNYILNVSFMTFVKHMEWKLSITSLHEEKQPRVMLLRYAHWIHTFLNPPYEFLKHFTTHKLIHLTWFDKLIAPIATIWQTHGNLNAIAIKAFCQNYDSNITTTWIKKHWIIDKNMKHKP